MRDESGPSLPSMVHFVHTVHFVHLSIRFVFSLCRISFEMPNAGGITPRFLLDSSAYDCTNTAKTRCIAIET